MYSCGEPRTVANGNDRLWLVRHPAGEEKVASTIFRKDTYAQEIYRAWQADTVIVDQGKNITDHLKLLRYPGFGGCDLFFFAYTH